MSALPKPNGINENTRIQVEIEDLLGHLGEGRIDGTPYDTAWVARLAPLYPDMGFGEAVEWLRHHQHEDGTWGTRLPYYHDRYISTLAAMVALREVGTHPRDGRRIERASDALWRLVGRLQNDHEDTIGFPIISHALSEDARQLGLNVPRPPLRFAQKYQGRVDQLLKHRQWQTSHQTFSLEGLTPIIPSIRPDETIVTTNGSIATSPAATAAYLRFHHDEFALAFMKNALVDHRTGVAPALFPIDVFEIVWSIHHLILADAIQPDDPLIASKIEFIMKAWSDETGIATSTLFSPTDIDDTAACFSVLRWAGYPISADIFQYFETPETFVCYHGETNQSVSSFLRTIYALRNFATDHPRYASWMDKLVTGLHHLDVNGTFWWDKWHVSPYYPNALALMVLTGLDSRTDELVARRLTWILKTQNDDGGWGYDWESTPEETAYCLEALLWWDRHMAHIDPTIIDAAGRFLVAHLDDPSYEALWISKGLYAPHYVVRATIIGAITQYSNWERS